MRFRTTNVALLFCVLLCGTYTSVYSQLSNKDLNVDDNKLRMEFEPGLFFNNGRSLNVLYTVTSDNNLSAGIYLMTSDVPDAFHNNMFKNILPLTHIRATEEYAVNFRYRIKLFRKYESNPYVGIILGWEEIKLTNPNLADLKYTTFLVTPHLGYEVYLYKKMLYMNVQLRSVFYVGSQKSDDTRLEELNRFWILPSLSIGLRI